MQEMQAQWIGTFSGTNSGHITLNIELIKNQLSGHAVLVDYNSSIPSSIAKITIEKKDNKNFIGNLSSFLPINKITLLPDSWEKVKKLFDPSVYIPSSGNIIFELKSDHSVTGQWNTDVNTKGEFSLTKSAAGQPSQYSTSIKTWSEFKELISSSQYDNYLFRGQTGSERLRTTFHRTERSDMNRYTSYMPELRKQIYAQTNKLFNLNDPEEYAALLSLAQHHGFPTPLLDWSKSPYVAAYFAYSGLAKINKQTHVRIYVFDAINWRNNTLTVKHLDSPVLSITPIEVLPILNNRANPQQSVTTFCNIDDIETFIQLHERKNNASYLKIIELPINEKPSVLKDLNRMNVNAGSLFPGLDGTCRMLKEMHFNSD